MSKHVGNYLIFFLLDSISTLLFHLTITEDDFRLYFYHLFIIGLYYIHFFSAILTHQTTEQTRNIFCFNNCHKFLDC